MSGGHFDYVQHKIQDASEDIVRLVEDNRVKDDWGYMNNYPPNIIEIFKDTAKELEVLSKKVKHIDYLVSGDYGEETFIQRWSQDGLFG